MHAKVQPIGAVKRASPQRSMAEVLTDVVGNLQDLLRSEIHLRQAQAREELRALRPAGVLITVGILGGLLSSRHCSWRLSWPWYVRCCCAAEQTS